MTRSDRGVQVRNRAGGLPRWLGRSLALVGAALVATLVAALPAAAGTVSIYDDAKVLNQTQVQNEAAKLRDPVSIYTTTKLASDNSAFDREAQTHVTNQNIVIAINTQSKHLAIRPGTQSRVSQSAAKSAADTFSSTFKGNSDYTAATVAALGSLNNATQSSHNSAGGGFSGIWLLIGVILVIAIIVVVVVGLMRRRSRSAPVYQQPAAYPAPGYGAPGYGPGYGPPVGGSGISPMAAGGIGAVAGGVLGYELGKMAGEHEGEEYREHHHGEYGGGYGDGGNYGGGGYGGGGADADFGGGGDSGGGGGDNF